VSRITKPDVGAPGFHSEITGEYHRSSDMVFVCRLTGRIHLCGPYCKGSLDDDSKEYVTQRKKKDPTFFFTSCFS
jgi:hypothetical protein